MAAALSTVNSTSSHSTTAAAMARLLMAMATPSHRTRPNLVQGVIINTAARRLTTSPLRDTAGLDTEAAGSRHSFPRMDSNRNRGKSITSSSKDISRIKGTTSRDIINRVAGEATGEVDVGFLPGVVVHDIFAGCLLAVCMRKGTYRGT
jgi:hypothetical protein